VRPPTAQEGQIAFGSGGLALQASGNLAAAGTLDLAITTDLFFGNNGGFAGILCVDAVRSNYALQSHRAVYFVAGRGETPALVATVLGSQAGSAAIVAHTITMPAAGTLRYTDTSGETTVVNLAFFGSKGPV
jgi:hypothetical protein